MDAANQLTMPTILLPNLRAVAVTTLKLLKTEEAIPKVFELLAKQTLLNKKCHFGLLRSPTHGRLLLALLQKVPE